MEKNKIPEKTRAGKHMKKGSGDETPVELIVSSSQYLSGLTCQLHCPNFLPVSVNAVWLN